MSEQKRILIVHEKHGIRYFDTSTDELLDKACKHILKERLDNGYYNLHSKVEPVVEEFDLTKIPESLHKQAKANHEHQKSMRAQWREDQDFLQQVKDTLASTTILMWRKFPKSYALLDERSAYEYERIQLDYLENV